MPSGEVSSVMAETGQLVQSVAAGGGVIGSLPGEDVVRCRMSSKSGVRSRYIETAS